MPAATEPALSWDYQSSQPLSFKNLKEGFILSKRKKPQAQKKYELLLGYASDWDDRNIKTIGYADIEKIVIELEDRLSSKTIYDFVCTLKMFWKWVIKCEGPRCQIVMPEFPEVKPVMAYRKILTKEQQTQVLDEI